MTFFIPNVLAEDVIFVSDCLFKAKGILFINIPIVTYLIRNNNKNGSLSVARNYFVLSSLLDGLITYKKKLLEIDEKYVWLAVRHLDYWTSELLHSSLDNYKKYELLLKSLELFEDYNKSDNIQCNPKYKIFFEAMFEKIILKQFQFQII